MSKDPDHFTQLILLLRLVIFLNQGNARIQSSVSLIEAICHPLVGVSAILVMDQEVIAACHTSKTKVVVINKINGLLTLGHALRHPNIHPTNKGSEEHNLNPHELHLADLTTATDFWPKIQSNMWYFASWVSSCSPFKFWSIGYQELSTYISRKPCQNCRHLSQLLQECIVCRSRESWAPFLRIYSHCLLEKDACPDFVLASSWPHFRTTLSAHPERSEGCRRTIWLEHTPSAALGWPNACPYDDFQCGFTFICNAKPWIQVPIHIEIIASRQVLCGQWNESPHLF